MPKSETHILVGLAVAIVILLIAKLGFGQRLDYSPNEWAGLALVVYLYSQLPDIDSDVSIINKIWNTTAALVGLYALYTGQLRLLGLFAIASIAILEWVKHRGIIHEEWFGVAFAAPLWSFSPLFAIVGLGSYISHIWLDGKFLD
jgi:hypothetical protein